MIKSKWTLSVLFIGLLILTGCASPTTKDITAYNNWEEIVEAGSGKEVIILMWGGNEQINKYMDTYVADGLKEQYDIILRRVPMGAGDYLNKLINEKKSGVEIGTADLVWINAENFRTAKDGGLLSGPFTAHLPIMNAFYDNDASDMHWDSGVPIDGYEAIWGKAQLVFTYDSAVISNPPKNFEELKTFVKENPGQFTYPVLPDDFVGTAFVRTAYYELTGEYSSLNDSMTYEEFETLSEPVMAYFEEIAPYLWEQGETYPATQSALDDLFKNGEVAMTMGFEIGKTAGQIEAGIYPDTVKTFVFDTGTIGNSHYLAIPYNAPNNAGAMLAINFLQSPEAQIEKMNPSVWGDMPGFDTTKIGDDQLAVLAQYETVEGAIDLETLNGHRLPEMQAQYIDWIKDIWVKNLVD